MTQQGALGAGCILPEDITSGGGDPSSAQRIFDAVGCLPHSPLICFLLLCLMSSVTSACQKSDFVLELSTCVASESHFVPL